MSNSNNTNRKSQKPWEKFICWVNGDTVPEDGPRKPEEIPDGRKATVRSEENTIEGTPLSRIRKFRKFYIGAAIVICCAFIGLLLFTASEMPPFGAVDVPTNNEVAEKYILDGVKDTGATNIVAPMILDYRAFDTLGESTVLFTAVMSVIILLRKDKDHVNDEEDLRILEEHRILEERPNVVLKTVGFLMVPFIFLFGIYVILNGHISPGGGFSGGAVLGAGLILYANAFGFSKLRKFFNFKVFTAFTSGPLLVYAGLKTYSFYTGANHIESIFSTGTPGAILSGGLILPLNICVGMIVACTMFGFYSLFSKGEI